MMLSASRSWPHVCKRWRCQGAAPSRLGTTTPGRKQACRLAGGRSARLCIVLCGLYGSGNQSNWLEGASYHLRAGPKSSLGAWTVRFSGGERERGEREGKKRQKKGRSLGLQGYCQVGCNARARVDRSIQCPCASNPLSLSQGIAGGAGPGASEGFVQFEPSLETSAASSSSRSSRSMERHAARAVTATCAKGRSPVLHLAPASTHCCRDRHLIRLWLEQ